MRKKRVIIGMSGGVDSSVGAALLKRRGYDTIGVFMKFWKAEGSSENSCCTAESERRARLVAKKLKIPFRVFNFEAEFKKRVVDYFLKASRIGLTPNPCVACNKEIKFGLLFEKALSLGLDYIATGHYAKIKKKGPVFSLLKAKDKEKDQSYFLWQLSQNQLRRTIFPVGGYTKREIRELAKKEGLPAAAAPESQEICFINKTLEDFLRKYLKREPGEIIDNKGSVLGRHSGLWLYTIGQRKGIKLSGGPYYVLRKDLKKNQLIVTKNEKDLLEKEARAQSINWISGNAPDFPFRATAKIRYNHKGAQAKIFREGKRIKAEFLKPQRAITPGQSLVLYKKEELLGGGIII